MPGISLSTGEGCIVSISNYIKKKILNIRWFDYKIILYIQSFALSQLARLDYFSDIVFIVLCFKCDQYEIGYVSLVVISIITLFNLYSYLHLIFKKKLTHPLPTERLNDYYEITRLMEMNAVGDLLDICSCFNVRELPDSWGRCMSSRIFANI